MKFTVNWLSEYVDLEGVTAERLGEDLTMVGLEVEAVTPLYEKLAALKTGRVRAVSRHPNADRLTLCTVDVGDAELEIVCGAPNVREGLAVVVALPGTTLPGNVTIKKAKVRGVVSAGMICSERELGLSDEHEGIMELEADTAIGASFVDCCGLRDTQLEVDLTPNRPDCASVIGIAREVAGIYRRPLSIPYRGTSLAATSGSFAVEVENPDLCPRYAARLITGVKIGPSPWWLKKRLLSVGLRPINNVVDITNLVMLEYGQPLHAFDFRTLAGGRIVVRTPRADERVFTTLDGVERRLAPDMLMICDGDKPIAVGGVMGGLDSEVTEETTDVLLESACFNDISIRKTARALNLSTDASYRFERGVDPGGTIDALQRAVTLMTEIAGGHAEPGGIDVCVPAEKRSITLSTDRTNALLGLDCSRDRIGDLLGSIEIGCEPLDDDRLQVSVPSFRVDLDREADLIEEVARLYGYNEIPVTLPSVALSYPEQDRERLRRIEAAAVMTRAGFSEAVNYSFVSSAFDDALRLAETDPRRRHVRLLNPLSEEQDVMRTSLLPGLLDNVRRNFNFQQTAVRLFEIGKVFHPQPDEQLPAEPLRLGAVLAGNRYGGQAPLHFPAVETDIADARGAVETLLDEMRLTGVDRNRAAISLEPAADDAAEPFCADGCAIEVKSGGHLLGTIGRFDNEILLELGIKRDVFYVDLDFSALSALPPAAKTFTALPVYPSVKRDLAIVVPSTTAAGDLVEAVLAGGEKLVERCDLFDIYQGDKIGPGTKSVALTITYRSTVKTLTEKQVEKAHAGVVRLLTDTFGGSLREE